MAVPVAIGAVVVAAPGAGKTTRIAPALLPHLRDRPLTLKRYPNGVDGDFFYEKQCPKHRPDWIGTAPMRRKDGKVINYCLLNDRAALAWASNLANLELHTSLGTATAYERPTMVAFDLEDASGPDIARRALSAANSCLYGVCHAAILVAGVCGAMIGWSFVKLQCGPGRKH